MQQVGPFQVSRKEMPLKRQLLDDCQYKVSGRHNNLSRRGDTVRTESEFGKLPQGQHRGKWNAGTASLVL